MISCLRILSGINFALDLYGYFERGDAEKFDSIVNSLRNHSSNHQKSSEESQNSWLGREITTISNKMGIKRPVEVRYSSDAGSCTTKGANIWPFKALLGIGHELTEFVVADTLGLQDQFFTERSKEATEVTKNSIRHILKHEFAHIKHYDSLFGTLFTTCSFASTFFFDSTVSTIATLSLIHLMGILYSRFVEQRADNVACHYSNDEEKKAVIQFFTNCVLSLNLSRRTGFFGRLKYDKKGNNRLDYRHPSLTSRIKEISKTLTQPLVLQREAPSTSHSHEKGKKYSRKQALKRIRGGSLA